MLAKRHTTKSSTIVSTIDLSSPHSTNLITANQKNLTKAPIQKIRPCQKTAANNVTIFSVSNMVELYIYWDNSTVCHLFPMSIFSNYQSIADMPCVPPQIALLDVRSSARPYYKAKETALSEDASRAMWTA